MAGPRITRRWVIPALALSLALVLIGAGAAAAVETDTVATFARGLWWSLALMTTVGFIGGPPVTGAGAALSVILMVAGFLLLALVSAALASLFVRDDEQGFEDLERADLAVLLAEVRALREQVSALAGGRAVESASESPSARSLQSMHP